MSPRMIPAIINSLQGVSNPVGVVVSSVLTDGRVTALLENSTDYFVVSDKGPRHSATPIEGLVEFNESAGEVGSGALSDITRRFNYEPEDVLTLNGFAYLVFSAPLQLRYDGADVNTKVVKLDLSTGALDATFNSGTSSITLGNKNSLSVYQGGSAVILTSLSRAENYVNVVKINTASGSSSNTTTVSTLDSIQNTGNALLAVNEASDLLFFVTRIGSNTLRINRMDGTALSVNDTVTITTSHGGSFNGYQISYSEADDTALVKTAQKTILIEDLTQPIPTVTELASSYNTAAGTKFYNGNFYTVNGNIERVSTSGAISVLDFNTEYSYSLTSLSIGFAIIGGYLYVHKNRQLSHAPSFGDNSQFGFHRIDLSTFTADLTYGAKGVVALASSIQMVEDSVTGKTYISAKNSIGSTGMLGGTYGAGIVKVSKSSGEIDYNWIQTLSERIAVDASTVMSAAVDDSYLYVFLSSGRYKDSLDVVQSATTILKLDLTDLTVDTTFESGVPVITGSPTEVYDFQINQIGTRAAIATSSALTTGGQSSYVKFINLSTGQIYTNDYSSTAVYTITPEKNGLENGQNFLISGVGASSFSGGAHTPPAGLFFGLTVWGPDGNYLSSLTYSDYTPAGPTPIIRSVDYDYTTDRCIVSTNASLNYLEDSNTNSTSGVGPSSLFVSESLLGVDQNWQNAVSIQIQDSMIVSTLSGTSGISVETNGFNIIDLSSGNIVIGSGITINESIKLIRNENRDFLYSYNVFASGMLTESDDSYVYGLVKVDLDAETKEDWLDTI